MYTRCYLIRTHPHTQVGGMYIDGFPKAIRRNIDSTARTYTEEKRLTQAYYLITEIDSLHTRISLRQFPTQLRLKFPGNKRLAQKKLSPCSWSFSFSRITCQSDCSSEKRKSEKINYKTCALVARFWRRHILPWCSTSAFPGRFFRQ